MVTKLTYKQASELAFTVRWKLGTCFSGDDCWCRPIQGEQPIMFDDGGVESEYFIARSGELSKDIAEYFVKLHNEKLEN
jgi:hypothetical protein